MATAAGFISGGLFSHTTQSMTTEETGFSMLSDNEQISGNIEEVLKYFHQYNLYTDVVFKVRCGDGYISFPAHKLVMALRSPVFADMFFGPNKKTGKDIEISDVPPSAFEVLIKYCYGSNEELKKNRTDVNFLLKVFKAAEKYSFDSLQVSCCDMFSSASPTKDNVFELLDAAVLTGSDCLRLRCYKVLQRQTLEILSSQDVFSVTPAVINTILDMPTLSLNSEYDLLNWLFEWGSFTSAKNEGVTFQEVMDPYLSRVNFLSLSPSEFGMLVKKYRKFFNEKEAFAIFMHIVCPDSEEQLPIWCRGAEIVRTFTHGDTSTMSFDSLSVQE